MLKLTRFGSRRWAALVTPLLMLALVILVFGSIQRLIAEVDYDDVTLALRATPWHSVALAVLFTAASFVALSFYDVSALAYAGRRLPYPIVALTAFCAYAVGNTAGFGIVSAGAVRFRFYSRFGAEPDEIARIIGFVTAAFGLGLTLTTALGALVSSDEMASIVNVSPPLIQASAAVLLILVSALLLIPAARQGALRLGRHTVPWPSVRVVLLQAAATLCDITATAAVLWVLLPPLPIAFPGFAAIFAVAIGLGVVSHVPAGLGVFETVIVAALGNAVPVDNVLGALILYRLVYHALPLVLSTAIIGSLEVRRIFARKAVSRAVVAAGRLAPQSLAVLSMVAGTILIVAGVTPLPAERLEFLSNTLPLPILEGANFLSSVLGMVLLIAARGLAHRLDGSWWMSLSVTGLALFLAALRASNITEIVLLAVLLAALLATQREFNRPSRMLRQPLTGRWLVAIVTVVVMVVAVMLFAYRDIEYTNELWWQFEFAAEAPRSLRAALAVVLVTGAVGVWSLTRFARLTVEPPAAAELAEAAAIVQRQFNPNANLVLMGDKSLVFSEARDAFIMFAQQGRSWIALFDPVGPKEAWPELIFRFSELARLHGGRPVFYQVRPENLSLYADAGLYAFKLGENAQLKLKTFDLAGAKRADFRRALNKGEREGLGFEVLEPQAVALCLDDLQAVSDAWLAKHNVREKRFSLGAFDRTYVASQPTAVLRQDGRIVAFATVLRTALKDEISVDLMRFSPDASNVTMDYLFAKLILHFKEEGYVWLDLGMAPLAGFQPHATASVWNRVAHTVFEHGERFYHFRGLRSFKGKFLPEWQSRFIAVGGGRNPLLALADVAVLIGGGVRGVVAK
ncbi:bifunctional lysylphosphatidylglycerol flippase/synthetase MprF [Consotaella salsifontis]|nr:bifunctional lysylphosphatidylglycerol flippase/synthetase MprF [Consotaella salsifontis]